MPGPKPLPTKVLEARGSTLVRKRGPEPPVELCVPPCPDWLRPEAAVFYDRVSVVLQKMRVLTSGDLDALSRYCQTLAKWKEAEEFLMKHGSTFEVYHDPPQKDAAGKLIPRDIKKYPQVSMAQKYSDQAARFEGEFGLTPSARVSINAIPGAALELKRSRFFKKREALNGILDQKKEA